MFGKREKIAKIKGYHNQLVTYEFLASLHFYRLALKHTAHLSYLLQRSNAIITDLIEAIEETKDNIQELNNSEPDLPFPVIETPGCDEVKIEASATNPPATQAFKQHHEMTAKQRRRAMKEVTDNNLNLFIYFVCLLLLQVQCDNCHPPKWFPVPEKSMNSEFCCA